MSKIKRVLFALLLSFLWALILPTVIFPIDFIHSSLEFGLYISILIYFLGLPSTIIYYSLTRRNKMYKQDVFMWIGFFAAVYLTSSMIILGFMDFFIGKILESLMIFMVVLFLSSSFLFIGYKMKKEPYQGDNIWHRWDSTNLEIKKTLANKRKKNQ